MDAYKHCLEIHLTGTKEEMSNLFEEIFDNYEKNLSIMVKTIHRPKPKLMLIKTKQPTDKSDTE